MSSCLAPDEMKSSTDLPIRVATACFELDRGDRLDLLCVSRVERRSAEFEPIDKQPRSVPALGLDAVSRDQLTDFFHRVRPGAHPEDADPCSDVKRCQRVRPPSFQSRLDGHGVRVAGHDRNDAAFLGAPAKLRDQRFGILLVAEHTVAQEAGKSLARHRFVRVLSVGLPQRHPLPRLGGQQIEALPRLIQHRRGRVENRDLVPGLGERERLVARAASDIEHLGRRRRQMLQQVLVQHVSAHVSLHRGIRVVHEQVRQAGARPWVIAHSLKIAVSN